MLATRSINQLTSSIHQNIEYSKGENTEAGQDQWKKLVFLGEQGITMS